MTEKESIKAYSLIESISNIATRLNMHGKLKAPVKKALKEKKKQLEEELKTLTENTGITEDEILKAEEKGNGKS